MSARPSLDDAFDKLRWARHHFEVLRSEVEPFEKRDAHTISVEVDADSGEYVFRVHNLEAPDPDWGLRIGDCLHNGRTALDYLMVRIVALVTDTEPRDVETVQFPIHDDPKAFASRIGSLRKQHPVFSGYLTRIEELQPFNVGNPSIWGMEAHGGWPLHHMLPMALKRLSTLDNIDKHRVIHAAWTGVDFLRSNKVEPPTGFKFLSGGSTGVPLKDGAVVGNWRFGTPLPSTWEPSQVEMKRSFPFYVTVDQPPTLVGILEVLGLCLWAVEAVLTLFGPVFLDLQPPLPVTAIPSPR